MGGLVEFYRSPDAHGHQRVPDYPKLAQLWWQNISLAVEGEKTPQQAMDSLVQQMDDVLGRLERAGTCRTARRSSTR